LQVGYCRVSLASQSHALQIDALTAAGCEKIFVETGSGARDDRPELRKAIEFCRSGDVLTIYSLSRLSRSLRHTLEIVEELGKREINLKSLTEAIDTTSPAGRLLLNFCGLLNQIERETLSQRTKDGLAAARARNRFGGRPRALDDNKLRVARALIADGQMTMAEVASHVGCAQSTLYRTLPGGRAAAQGGGAA
jgi:DNA invertase Pin-like site-specific DNA recombinase